MMPSGVLAIPLKHPFTMTSVVVKRINQLLMTLPIFRECVKHKMKNDIQRVFLYHKLEYLTS